MGKFLVGEKTVMTQREVNRIPEEIRDVLTPITDTEAKYVRLISDQGSVWKESEIVAFRSRLNMRKDSASLLSAIFFENIPLRGWKITQEQTEKGIEFLKRSLFKNSGGRRNTELSRSAPECLFQAVEHFESFRFVGLEFDPNTVCGGRECYVPIYRILTVDGGAVDYAYFSHGYQRGGYFEARVVIESRRDFQEI